MSQPAVVGVWPREGGEEQGVFSLHANGLAGVCPRPPTARDRAPRTLISLMPQPLLPPGTRRRDGCGVHRPVAPRADAVPVSPREDASVHMAGHMCYAMYGHYITLRAGTAFAPGGTGRKKGERDERGRDERGASPPRPADEGSRGAARRGDRRARQRGRARCSPTGQRRRGGTWGRTCGKPGCGGVSWAPCRPSTSRHGAHSAARRAISIN